MSILRESLKQDGPFLDRKYLSKKYVPEKLLMRDEEKNTIEKHIGNHFSSGMGHHLLIHGPPGTGKTHTIKRIKYDAEDLLEEENIDGKIVYHKCDDDSLYEVFIRLNQKFRDYPSSGVSLSRAMNDLSPHVTNERTVIVLDEFDKIRETHRTVGDPINTTVRQFTRLHEESSRPMDVQLQLILITNDPSIKARLESHNIETFSPITVQFSRYGAEDILMILKDRCQKAFREGVVKEGAISLLSALVKEEGGDIRGGLKTLEIAGEQMYGGNEKIDEADIRDAIAIKNKNDVKSTIRDLSIHEMLVLTSICSKNKSMSKEMYSTYKKLINKTGYEPKSLETVRKRILPRLDDQGLIKTERKGKANQGVFTYFYPGDDNMRKMIYDVVDGGVFNELELPPTFVGRGTLRT